ncbi:sodium/proline symporter [Virgibacillus phasianinus]|uniref:Sodium/proline symporter n=1 Tax=Virgibacillus phasianinus TaxID=2017483 RepID=A0A220U4M0_9BACI|nr:sodium/proline symporter PutP [Virgibacillus phasianinus]ASK62673.1 sodium/proline symporter [Virgibacillus phasianinus]
MEAIITFSIYCIGMLIIGLWTYSKTSSLSDYILGGRSLNPWVAALSAQASDFSGWLLLGLPGAVYASGINGMWIGVGLAVGAYLNWQFIAKRLRRYTEVSRDSVTLPEFFENRFRDKSHSLRVVSALFILIFYMIYVASGLVASGKLFVSIFDGMSFSSGLWIGAIVVIAYTFLGGFLAASYTDFIQGSLMFLALIIAPVYVIWGKLGGLSGLWEKLSSINPDLLYATSSVTSDFGNGVYWQSAGTAGFIAIISLLAWGLGYPGQPHIVARFMGIRSTKDVPKAKMIAMIWIGISLWGAIFVALAGIVFFGSETPLADPEQVFIQLIPAVFDPWTAGFLLAAVLAAIMSTMDSQLVVACSALAEDFYKPFFRKKASGKELVWVGRIATVVIAGIALAIAFSGSQSVLGIVAYAWAGFGSVFGPPVIFALWWRRTTSLGVLLGMIVGGVTVILWEIYPSIATALGVGGLYSLVPGFVLACLVIWIVSMLGKVHPEVEEEFNQAVAE